MSEYIETEVKEADIPSKSLKITNALKNNSESSTSESNAYPKLISVSNTYAIMIQFFLPIF
jgi:hypothetical protein